MDDPQVAAYLERIGVVHPPEPDIDALRTLQRAHLGSVPFENLSVHLGEPIVLDEQALFSKIVQRNRGGFCYELNGAFAALLTALGYRVSLHSARVFGGARFGPPLDHMPLRIELAEPWLVDVGFGRFSDYPLRLDIRDDQTDPSGTFRVVEHSEDLDVLHDGQPQLRVDPRPYQLDDFAPTCWWQQTSPDSHFTQSLTCSLRTETGRITLSGDRLIETVGAARTETTVPADELLAAYQRHFGITLDRPPVLRDRDKVGLTPLL